MASVRSCVSVKPAAGPARYRSARLGAASLEPRSLRLSSPSSSLPSAADGCSSRGVGCAASSSGRGDGAVAGLVRDGGSARRRMGGREAVAMCSASLEGVSHSAVASVPTAPALPERVKVVALMAAVMLLCNADRVVMSVAVVPLAAQHGWSSSFVGIVQGYFVLLSWMPVYFKTVYDVNLKQAAWFSAIPWAVMALSGYVAGASADYLIKSGFSTVRVRKIMQDIAPQYAGSLHGMTNGIGVVGRHS
ncbi:hypothetical protein ACQ4PT_056850 [Festuca glaucescens]